MAGPDDLAEWRKERERRIRTAAETRNALISRSSAKLEDVARLLRTEPGKALLSLLAEWYDGNTFDEDSRTSAYLEGQRSVLINLKQVANSGNNKEG